MKAGKIVLLGMFFCTTAAAEDGLVVHFTIKKTAPHTVNTYANGVLLRLTENSTQSFPGQHEVRLESRAIGNGEVNLVVTLKDLSGRLPLYAGSGAAMLKVGSSVDIPLHQLAGAANRYEVAVDTSYGPLPQTARP